MKYTFKVQIFTLTDEIEKELIKLLVKKGDFSKADSDYIRNLSKKFNLSKKLLYSLRSQALKQKVIEKHFLIKRNMNNLILDYQNMNILDISKKYDLPPMSIMREIIKKKYNFKINEKLKKKLNEIDLKQLNIDLDNDITSQINQDDKLEESINYEKKIERALIKKNVKFKTQEELVTEQKKEYGKAMITPDFLFDDYIFIN